METENNIQYMVLWITDDCNLRCKYCYANAGKRKSYMDRDTFIKALDLAGNNNYKLQIAGGEPLLNFLLIEEIYDYLQWKNPKIKISLQTNGTLINTEMAKKIKEMDIGVGVSLDGPIDINEQFRGKTLETIKGIKKLGKENVIVNLNSVITDENIKYLDKLVDLAFYLGNVYGIGLDLLRKTGRYMENQGEFNEASGEDIKKYLNKAYGRSKYLYEVSGKKIILREIEDARFRLKMGNPCKDYCYAALGSSMVVLPNGDIYPCSSFVGNGEYYMGNVHNRDSIKNIKLRDKTREYCRSCQYERYCSRGCPARLLINDEEIPLDCILRKTAFEIVSKELNLNI